MRARFSPEYLRVMQVCQRNGWTLAHFWSLDEDEQFEWLAFEQYRDDQFAELQKFFQKKQHSKSDPKRTYSNWTPDVAATVLSAKFGR